MSYQEQAEKMNEKLKDTLETLHMFDKNKLINTILWFGQVAKFRCRSNAAYDNFCKCVFEGIVDIERTKKEGMDFEILQVKDDKES